MISFFANLYSERYAAVWKDFLDAAGRVQPASALAPRYVYAAPTSASVMALPDKAVAASYRYSRLCFKADVIEPLSMEATFEVITPDGIFRMTKADFYRDFANVVDGTSYRISRIYHYPKTSRHASKYRISPRAKTSMNGAPF